MTRTILVTTAAALAIWGGGSALAQEAAGAERMSVTKVHAERRGKRGGRRAMMQFLRQADANGDRALTQAELDAFVAEQVTKADANSDGDISLAEFEAIWLEMNRQRMVRAFQRLDLDASGAVTAEERTRTFGDVVSRLDRNDDGKFDRADRRGRWGRRGDR